MKYASGSNLYIMTDTVGSGLYLFSQSAFKEATYTLSAVYKMSLNPVEPMKIIEALYNPSTLSRFLIQLSGATYTIVQEQTITTTLASTATFTEPTSVFFYFCGSQDGLRMQKVDYTNLAGTIIQPNLNSVTFKWGRNMNRLPGVDRFFVNGEQSYNLVIDMLTMTELQNIPCVISGSTFEVRVGRFNNLNNSEYFIATNDPTVRTGSFRKTKYQAGDTVFIELASPILN